MKRFRFVFILLLLPAIAFARNDTVENMRSQRLELERKMADQEKILTTTETSIAGQLSNLKILDARVAERNRVLAETKHELERIRQEQQRLEREISSLEKEHDKCLESYREACLFCQAQNFRMNSLTFLLSSDSFRQLSRRVRYIKEYSGSVERLAMQIESQRDTIEARKVEVEAVLQEKKATEQMERLLVQTAQKEQQEQQRAVDKLKQKRSQIKKEIAAQQKQMDALAKEIEKQIQLAMKESVNSTPKGQSSEQDFKLSGSFESNKGKLPMPISGPYLIVGKYGISQVAGQKDVKQNNLGIDIQGQAGAKALCVFDGNVTGIFQHGRGQLGILVRHGKYITVYCNLVSTTLKKGDTVKAGSVIGIIQTSDNGSPVLHFQLHSGSTRLNPQDWLRR